MIDVIKYPVSTEKNIRIMEAENKLIFVVNKKSKYNSNRSNNGT